jgi:hypothetical protein
VGKNPDHLKKLLKNRKRTQLSFLQLPSSFKQEGTKGIEGYGSFKFLPSFLDIYLLMQISRLKDLIPKFGESSNILKF